VRESLPVSDRVAGSKSACTSISLWFHLVRSVWPPYSMTELTQESDLYRYKDHSDERPCKSIRTEHRQAADSLGTFLPSRASDLTRPSSTRATRFLLPKPLVVLPIFQGRPRRNRHRQPNPLQYRRISTSLDTISFSATQKPVRNDSLISALTAWVYIGFGSTIIIYHL
jgi:hypothetical protein